ncbi:universal stress protein [Natronorubrum sp. JWXQ-INN-674]|uniref:Universal stress protein n=1 Tax=Natronorubrum halalkaliphilum TaxID=2691917 RepID=A0A6B0VQI5_9EURY|nr:universal stress protein [Natronorubrum halalkaliphilum]MXV64071.1 universal stress protein [Natronorubrum halalkaliphilum]
MYDTILVATDGSQPANRAVDHAMNLASTFDAPLHAIYVVDTRRYGDSVLGDSAAATEELESRGRELLEDIQQRADIDVTIEIRHGRPHQEISEYAETIDTDLVVLGNRGLGSGGEIGSNAERVVRNVDRPVITA